MIWRKFKCWLMDHEWAEMTSYTIDGNRLIPKLNLMCVRCGKERPL
jgi:hypothetical protein